MTRDRSPLFIPTKTIRTIADVKGRKNGSALTHVGDYGRSHNG
jgi:hypothetical protein